MAGDAADYPPAGHRPGHHRHMTGGAHHSSHERHGSLARGCCGTRLTDETVVIDRRFQGPPDSGHGGYTCGLLAREIPGAAAVSLHLPPPLDRQLTLERVGDGRVLLRDGEQIVADARPATLELDPPPAVALSDAQTAASRSEFARHPFPTCFGCGPEREQGDGLRLFPGPVDGRNVIACPWHPDASLADENGRVRTEFVWSALDCPTGWSCELADFPVVLARLIGQIDRPLHTGEELIITAWRVGRDGRKQHSACAIWAGDGELLARSQALWIELTDPTSFGATANHSGSEPAVPVGRTSASQ
jgi:hypothetical protein